MIKIVFMGTPDFAVPTLRQLIETQRVEGVVTQPDRPAGRGKKPRPSPVKLAAEAAGIPVYQPKSLRSEAAAAPLRDWEPDMIIVAAYGQILRPHVLNLPPLGCLNVHASLLPRWRGASPIQHAILAGDAETGVSLMRMDEGMDTGPVYVRQAILIRADETAATLHDRLAELGAAMVGDYLEAIAHGRLPAAPQDNARATYAPLIKKEDGRLDWQQKSVELERRIRAMTPWPGAFTTWEGVTLKLLSAHPVNGRLPQGAPGQVVESQGEVVVLTPDGGLALEEVQLAGRRAMNIVDFLRGKPNLMGARLGS
ncbi:MAG: methionyl-tRNA formyltransferase [Anaerolineae bacterium]